MAVPVSKEARRSRKDRGHRERLVDSASPHREVATRPLTIFIYLLLVGITWSVFGQTLAYDFVNFDDHIYVYDTPEITRGMSVNGVVAAFTRPHAHNWHPLTTISHMLDCQFYRLRAGGHHFTNVVLHTITVLLLYRVLRQMTGGSSRTGNIWQSGVVAALFAIHPLHVESVAWVSERKDVLSGLFCALRTRAIHRPLSRGRCVIRGWAHVQVNAGDGTVCLASPGLLAIKSFREASGSQQRQDRAPVESKAGNTTPASGENSVAGSFRRCVRRHVRFAKTGSWRDPTLAICLAS